MRKIRKPQLLLEQLELRDCPSATITLYSSMLTLRGRPNSSLLIEGQGGNNFKVMDGTASLGTYNLGGRGLQILMPSRGGELNIDLKNNSIGGNVLIDLGLGHTGPAGKHSSVDIYDSLTDATAGEMRGNLLMLNGNGFEFINIGGFETGFAGIAPAPTAAPITVRGNLTAVGRTAGVKLPAIGDALILVPGADPGVTGTRVLGSVSATQVETVGIGLQGFAGSALNGTFIGKNVSATNTTAGLSVDIFGEVAGSVSATSLGVNSSFSLDLESDPAGTGNSVGGIVRGNVNVRHGEGTNFFSLQDSGASDDVTEVFGNVSYSSGSGGDFAFVRGRVNGSVTFNLGEGDNTVHFSNFLGGTNNAFIAGNFNINAGNGDNLVGTGFFGTFAGDLGGNLTVRLGNGSNQVTLDPGLDVGGDVAIHLGNGGDVFTPNQITDNADSVGGTFRIRTGNGATNVDLNRTALYVLDAVFGNGDDTLTFGGLVGTQVTGSANGGGRITANTLNQNDAEFLPTFVLSNFP